MQPSFAPLRAVLNSGEEEEFDDLTAMASRLCKTPVATREGVAAGAVCVLDTKPRVLTQEARKFLRSLARQATRLLETRWADSTDFHPKTVGGGDLTGNVGEAFWVWAKSVPHMVRLVLGKYGYEVVMAENDPHALEAWRQREGGFDLLLTDWRGSMICYSLANLRNFGFQQNRLPDCPPRLCMPNPTNEDWTKLVLIL